MNNKDKVAALLKSIETGIAGPISYINPEKYIQHNLAVADGLAGFGRLLQALPPRSARVNTVRLLQDGDFVAAHTEYNFFGLKAGFDIFRFENGLIVEHWDNLQPIAPVNPGGHTMFDGPAVITDLEKTADNKTLVENFLQDVLMGRNPAKITGYISSTHYTQHNPQIADGLSGLNAALQAMAAQGISMKYDHIHRLIGEGNFVLAVSEGSFAGQATAFFDLFRIEAGQIVEHWDVIETIPPRSEWKNANGKF